MKISDISLSLMLHGAIALGVGYCALGVDGDSSPEDEVEAVFFEILEESAETTTPAESEVEEIKKPPLSDACDIPPQRPDSVESEDPLTEDFSSESVVNKTPKVVEEESIEEDAAEEMPVAEDYVEPPEDTLEREDIAPSEPKVDSNAVKELLRHERERPKIISAPMAVNRIEPVYPRSARRRGREGVVTLDVAVSASGKVMGVDVVAGSGHEDLDTAALSAVRSASFAPATEDGVGVSGHLRLTFEFKLR